MTSSEKDEILAAPAVELTHTGGPGLASEGLVDGDEVAALLASSEAGGAAVRGGALRVVGYASNALLGALAAGFLFRHLGRDGVGTYVTALSIAAIVAGLSDLGLTALGLRELSVRDPDSRARLMSNLLGLRISLTFLGIVGSVIFAIAVGYSSLLVGGVALAGAGLMLQNVQGTLALSLMSRLRLGLVTATELGRQTLTTVLTITLVAAGAGLLAFIGLSIPVGFVFLVLTAWLVRREVPLLPHFDRAEWRSLAREVLPYSVAVALAVIYFRLSVIVVSLTASKTQLSYFGASFRILEVLIVIPGLMVTGVFPIFARSAHDDRERFAYAVSRVFTVALIVGVWFALALALGAPIAIDAIGGSEFGKAVGVLQIQAVGLGGSFVSAVWGMTLLSLRRNREVMLVNLGGLIMGTALVVLLASAYGAKGAALGTAITEIFFAAAVPLVLRRIDPHVVPAMRVVPRVLLAGALACAIALIPGLPTVALVILSTAIYFFLLLVTRAIPDEVFVELRSMTTSARRAFAHD
jgi:O-antigen/teichoic acid export membrane protein